MNSNTIIFTSIAIFFLLVSSSYGKNVHTSEDDDFEVTQQMAAAFLMHDNSSHAIDKREAGRHCVPCKFGANPCCAPNICVKKTLRPDECQEIKTGK
jgi:hypothetical protein